MKFRSVWECTFLLLALETACSGRPPELVTAPVTRAPISERVTATGTLAAQDTILVGSQVSGTIAELYVDYNSQVHRGEVLANLDPSLFVAALDQAKATLAQLDAQRAVALSALSSAAYTSSAANTNAQSQAQLIAAADEDVRKAHAALALALLTLHRDRALLQEGYVAQNVVDSDVSNAAAALDALVAAQTNARTSRLNSIASIDQAGSSAAQTVGAAASQSASDAAARAAVAAVRQAEINLEHATITSPVDGTVIQRNVSMGQTVAAALQAPTLFTIAKDLKKMELDIAVGEPDVGSVRAGQRVSFSVLAYPNRVFYSTVNEVRQNPTIINNVTTYDTVAYPSNNDGALRPGMTANVQIVVANYDQATILPLAALQWRPSEAIARQFRISVPASGEGIPVARSQWGATNSSDTLAISVGGPAHCYVQSGDTLRLVDVTVLAIDGTNVGVRIESGVLGTGDRVIVDEAAATSTASNAP